MISLLTTLLAGSLLNGCVVYETSDAPPVNGAPWFNYLESGCFWDGGYGDDFWYFYADADDPDGPMDIVDVVADVYDNWSGAYIASFDLQAMNAYEWYVDYPAHTVPLDCFYPDYDVVFTAYDSFGVPTTATTIPYTY